MEEDTEVEAFPLGIEVQAEAPVGNAVADVGTVVGSNLVVVIGIDEAEVAGLRAGTVSGVIGISLGLVLQDALVL